MLWKTSFVVAAAFIVTADKSAIKLTSKKKSDQYASRYVSWITIKLQALLYIMYDKEIKWQNQMLQIVTVKPQNLYRVTITLTIVSALLLILTVC